VEWPEWWVQAETRAWRDCLEQLDRKASSEPRVNAVRKDASELLGLLEPAAFQDALELTELVDILACMVRPEIRVLPDGLE